MWLAHFCYKVVHCGIFGALLDLWDGSIRRNNSINIFGWIPLCLSQIITSTKKHVEFVFTAVKLLPAYFMALFPIFSWFPQTLKSAWIWMLSWKVLDFSISLENGKFSLKSAWKWLYGLEKYRHQKVESVSSVLYCTFELRKVARFSNFVITADPVSRVLHSTNYQINLFCIKFFVAVYIIEI